MSENKSGKNVAIVLAAGQGKRMNTAVPKQYITIKGYPVLYYSLLAFEESEIVDEVILVTGKEEIESCRMEYIKKYGFQKIKKIIAGGNERYDSVWNALQVIDQEASYVFIHDGARPMLDEEILQRGYACVKETRAAVAGVPSKDTIKVVDTNEYAKETLDRNYVWNIQTPQVFDAKLVKQAYQDMMEQPHENVTDDAMVVESYTDTKVKLFKGSYENIKITTPEDLKIAEVFLRKVMQRLNFI